MKVSYSILKKYLPFLESPEKTAQQLVMHTAEVENIITQSKSFENIVFGKITEIEKHENADSLKVCKVDIGESENLQIVCGGSNLFVGQGVAVAKIGASVVWHGQGEPVIMKKTSIRGVESNGMICAAEEIGLKEEFPAKDEKEILDISFTNSKPGTPLATILGKDDSILEIDNKAINHRPDMFSYMGIMRELSVIHQKKFELEYLQEDFSQLPQLQIENQIPDFVKRYVGLAINGVSNIDTPEEIKKLVMSAGNSSKGLLVDVSNYGLFFYGQPTHCFDADKIEDHIIIRFAINGEKFIALDNKEYTLSSEDIVIADTKKIIALGGVIGGKNSCVDENTKNIIVESAWFPGDILRHTGRRHGIRTDALNIFEKNIPLGLQTHGISLIYSILKTYIPSLQTTGLNDIYPTPVEKVSIPYDMDFVCKLIGKNYSQTQILNTLFLLGIEKKENNLIIPFWRKDLNKKADIAEEIARIDGYDTIEATTPRIDVGAVVQSPMTSLRQKTRNFFSDIGFFDMYNYSFVNSALMEKMGFGTEELIEMKNYLSEDVTHLRNSLIPNLLLGIENNCRERKNIKMFELEKVFGKWEKDIYEAYHLAGVVLSNEKVPYYSLQNTLVNYFTSIGVDKVTFEKPKTDFPPFTHKGRTAEIIVRGKKVGFLGEIHPAICENFNIIGKVAWFEINVEILAENAFSIVKAQDVSVFQENNFDISFVVDRASKGIDIQNKIKKSDTLIQKVELFDIYEDSIKLPGKRSLSFTVYFQSQTETLSDEFKNNLIKKIVSEVEKLGAKLR